MLIILYKYLYRFHFEQKHKQRAIKIFPHMVFNYLQLPGIV